MRLPWPWPGELRRRVGKRHQLLANGDRRWTPGHRELTIADRQTRRPVLVALRPNPDHRRRRIVTQDRVDLRTDLANRGVEQGVHSLTPS